MPGLTLQTSPDPEVPRRRNGRQQACEPCRKRKLACDHGVPVCKRCCHRKVATDCKYLVRGRPIAFGPRREPSMSATRQRATPEASSERRVEHSAPFSPSQPASPESERQASRANPTPAGVHNMGYFGLTSFSALFLETQSSLALAQQASPARKPELLTPVGIAQTSTTLQEAFYPRSVHSNIPAGTAVQVLEHIPPFRVALALFRKNINPNDGWNRLAAERLITSLWETFGSALRTRSQTELQAMAEVLTQNSQRPLNEDSNDAQEWMASFSGPNMRWECLGILFSYWSLASVHYMGEQDDPAHPNPAWRDPKGRRTMLCRYHELAGTSIAIADPTRNANSLVLYALYKYSLAESRVSGDACTLTIPVLIMPQSY